MTRKDLIRTMALAAFGSAFGRFDVFAIESEPHGMVTAPLDQWKWLVFQYKGKQVVLTTADVFAALEETFGSTPIPSRKT